METFYTGDFGSDGLLYLRHGNQYFGVNVDDLKVERVVTADSDVRRTYDIAYNPKTELHYSVRKNGTRAEFISIDLSGADDTAEVVVINDNLKPVGTYGAMFSDASGRVFAGNNAGGLYEIDLATGIATFAGHSPRASSNDGAFSAAATLDLPPVAFDAWVTLAPTKSSMSLPITAPYDLDGQEVTVTVTALPTVGSVTDSAGNNLEVGQVISVATLTNLLYEAPANSEDRVGSVLLNYQVSDGHQQVVAKVEISFAGHSRIEGNVFVLDDTEESSYEGYAYQNEIRLIGVDLLGAAVERTVKTDVEGRYRFEDVLPGEYRIEQVATRGCLLGLRRTQRAGGRRRDEQGGRLFNRQRAKTNSRCRLL